MPHFTDLIWLILIIAFVLVTAWMGRRTRLGRSWARLACERPRLVLIMTGVLYTVMVLQWSARNGRLATDPQWDDVVYLLDARQRLDAFDRQGLLKVIKSFWQSPPHSPWSSAVALFAFVFLGAHAWAPYVANVVVLIGFLLCLHAVLPASSLPPGERLLLSILPLLLPISARLIEEFRPDPALAVATAAFCLGMLKSSFFSPAIAGRWRTQFRFGLMAGVALLIKPSFLYHTLLIILLVQTCSTLAAHLRTGQAPPTRARAGSAAAFFGGALLVAGWYYVRALPQTLRYVHENTANNQDVDLRRLHADALGVLKNFFIDGEMARMLGPFLLIFAVVVASGLIHFLRHRRWSDAGYMACVLICAIASVSILACVRLDNPFF
ncbi:MAG: hypothetical protein JO069_13025, partial [Verrucomicrobia bacterium]|nr:hypothetical protein [Verrucomicrobiota bacterium]